MSGMFNFDVPDFGVGSSIMGMSSMGNPYMAGLQMVTSLFGGSSVKVSKAQTSGNAASGISDFMNTDKVAFNKPVIDLKDPLQVTLAVAGMIAVIYMIKKTR